jgi:hypothetical protein
MLTRDPSREVETTPQKANWQKLWCPSNNSNVEGWNKKNQLTKKDLKKNPANPGKFVKPNKLDYTNEIT